MSDPRHDTTATALFRAVESNPNDRTPFLLLADRLEELERSDFAFACRWAVANGRFPYSHGGSFANGDADPSAAFFWVAGRDEKNRGELRTEIFRAAANASVPTLGHYRGNERSPAYLTHVYFSNLENAIEFLSRGLNYFRQMIETPPAT